MTTSWGCKCTQCHRSSSWVDNLRKHLKEHSGDITNKCDHGGEKSKMCKMCGFIYIGTGVGHADASADAHRMRINAHRCASSAYCAKNDIPFFTYKLPFWLRFSKSLGPEPHQLTNISYVESGEVLSFCVNEAREYLYRYLFQELRHFKV